jgi:predicted signal transduction protein with EAL and GGDEF domain
MGGDEFAIILPSVPAAGTVERVTTVAQKVLEQLRTPFTISGQEIFVTCSIGIACYPVDGNDPQMLQKNADLAMYRAKSLGRNGFCLFSPELAQTVPDTFALESHLRNAIAHNELRLQFQPQVTANGRLRGVEALLRWRHPTLGNVPPAKFIPLAEETGIIVDIGRWVLDDACRQARAWCDSLGFPVRVAVNLSLLQFAQPGFADDVAAALARHGLDPHCLELEITETLLMKRPRETAQKLGQIRASGVGIALDDFGTGYSSLAYLQTLPIDVLKMDASFIRELQSNTVNTAAFVRAILSLGHSLGMHIIAEGVETPAQADFLIRAGCDAMQGYHLAKPMWPEEIAPLLKMGTVWVIPRTNCAVADVA